MSARESAESRTESAGNVCCDVNSETAITCGVQYTHKSRALFYACVVAVDMTRLIFLPIVIRIVAVLVLPQYPRRIDLLHRRPTVGPTDCLQLRSFDKFSRLVSI